MYVIMHAIILNISYSCICVQKLKYLQYIALHILPMHAYDILYEI